MTYKELGSALAVLGIGQRATMAQIRTRYRHLARLHHPDSDAGGRGDNSEQMQRVNAAYNLLREYCGDYSFDFSEKEFYEQDPEARLRRQFATDPVWGGLKEDP